MNVTTTLYRYEYRRNGNVIRTRWADCETAKARMESRIGEFHDCGRVSGDGDSNWDGSHNGCPRNGGMLSRDVKRA